MKVKRASTGGRRLQPEPTEPLEMPFQLRAGGVFQSQAEKVRSAELCLAQTQSLVPRAAGPARSTQQNPSLGAEKKQCFVTLNSSSEGNIVRRLLQCHADKQSVSLG